MNWFEIILALIVGTFCSLLCKKKTKSLLNYGSFYCLIWMVVAVFANSGLYDFYLPSTLVNICMIGGILIFGCVFIMFAPGRRESSSGYSTVVNYKLIVICNCIVFVFMLPVFLNALSLIATNGYTYLRAIAGTGAQELGTSSIKDLLLQSLCYPVIIASLLIGFKKMFLREHEATLIVVLAAINLTVYCISNAARNGFVVAIIIVMLTFLEGIRKKRNENTRKSMSFGQKMLILLLVSGAIFVVVHITNQRVSHTNSLFANLYMYLFAGPSFLTRLLEVNPRYVAFDGNLYGAATFGCVYNLLSLPLNYIGINIPNSDYIVNSVLTCDSLFISPVAKVNAMSTVFFPFIVDWGYLGIIIGPIIISTFSVIVVKKRITRQNIRWDAIGIYWYYYLYRTVFKHDGISFSFFFIFFFIFLFTNKTKIKLKVHSL